MTEKIIFYDNLPEGMEVQLKYNIYIYIIYKKKHPDEYDKILNFVQYNENYFIKINDKNYNLFGAMLITFNNKYNSNSLKCNVNYNAVSLKYSQDNISISQNDYPEEYDKILNFVQSNEIQSPEINPIK
jgi:hypothetical protein